ncbi:uncharacterized protein ACIBXB_010884 isoform 2-T2 [Morphnus guianensis]
METDCTTSGLAFSLIDIILRKFKLIMILKSKCSSSGRPCEGQKSAPVRGQFLFIAETAPLQSPVLPEQNHVLGSFSLSSECREQTQVCQLDVTAVNHLLCLAMEEDHSVF